MANPNFDPNQMHFFYKHKYLGSCEPGDAWCPKLLELMESDPAVASMILDYMNSLGDPVFPVSEEDWGTPETDINKVDIKDLYNTFLQELDYEYRDFPDDFYVGGDYRLPDFEIFVGEVADDVQACGDINCSTEPNSPDVDKSKLARQIIKQAKEIRDYFQYHNNNLNRKQEQYLEDLSDGIDNESVAAIRDAIENMKYNSKNLRSEQYNLIMDLYDEFNLAGGKFEGMGRSWEDGDVEACGDIKASTMPKPTIDSVLKLIADKKIIFKNDVAYLSRGKKVLPKEYRDCIYQTKYAHWINEWSCEQAEKFGDRAYYDYDGETEVDSCDKVTASTSDSNIVNIIYSVMMNYEYGYDPDMTDINAMLQELTNKGVHVDTSDAFKRAWVSAHNKAERKTWGGSGDSYHYDSLTPGELEAIENYDTEYWEYVKDHPFNLKPASATDITSSTCTPKYMANMVSAGSKFDYGTNTVGRYMYAHAEDVEYVVLLDSNDNCLWEGNVWDLEDSGYLDAQIRKQESDGAGLEFLTLAI